MRLDGKKNFRIVLEMEAAHASIDELMSELERALNSFLVEKNPEFDWSNWFSIIQKLRSDLFESLSSCEGKFDNDVNSVGLMAKRNSIYESLRQIQSLVDR
jgi:hypothetical protein